jgi:hypothetical protein
MAANQKDQLQVKVISRKVITGRFWAIAQCSVFMKSPLLFV